VLRWGFGRFGRSDERSDDFEAPNRQTTLPRFGAVAAAAGIVTVGDVASPDAGLSLMVLAVATASHSRFGGRPF
jgi:hypothetical protein